MFRLLVLCLIIYCCSLSTAAPYCGDGKCRGSEYCQNCPEDCGPCSIAVCGDGFCDSNNDETCSSCPDDCTDGCTPAVCGDGNCDVNDGETYSNCPDDCNVSWCDAISPPACTPQANFNCPKTRGVPYCIDCTCCNNDSECQSNNCNTGRCEPICDDGICGVAEENAAYNTYCSTDCAQGSIISTAIVSSQVVIVGSIVVVLVLVVLTVIILRKKFTQNNEQVEMIDIEETVA